MAVDDDDDDCGDCGDFGDPEDSDADEPPNFLYLASRRCEHSTWLKTYKYS